jgi:hypothetical protein
MTIGRGALEESARTPSSASRSGSVDNDEIGGDPADRRDKVRATPDSRDVRKAGSGQRPLKLTGALGIRIDQQDLQRHTRSGRIASLNGQLVAELQMSAAPCGCLSRASRERFIAAFAARGPSSSSKVSRSRQALARTCTRKFLEGTPSRTNCFRGCRRSRAAESFRSCPGFEIHFLHRLPERIEVRDEEHFEAAVEQRRPICRAISDPSRSLVEANDSSNRTSACGPSMSASVSIRLSSSSNFPAPGSRYPAGNRRDIAEASALLRIYMTGQRGDQLVAVVQHMDPFIVHRHEKEVISPVGG